jgi:hypothetical protein
MTESADFKFKIEFNLKDMVHGKDSPDVKCMVYGNSGKEVLANYHELMRELTDLTWQKTSTEWTT